MGGELLLVAVEIQLASSACAAGVLPFGLRRQTIAVGGEIAFPRAGRVARRQAFRLGAKIAKQRGVRPADAFDGMVVMLEFRGILAHDFRVFRLRDVVFIHVEGRYGDGMRLFVRLPLRVAHRERPAVDQHHFAGKRRRHRQCK